VETSELVKTYYGNQFFKILQLDLKKPINQDFFNKISNYSAKLNLKISVSDKNSFGWDYHSKG